MRGFPNSVTQVYNSCTSYMDSACHTRPSNVFFFAHVRTRPPFHVPPPPQVDVYANWVPKDRILATNTWSSELSKLVANGEP